MLIHFRSGVSVNWPHESSKLPTGYFIVMHGMSREKSFIRDSQMTMNYCLSSYGAHYALLGGCLGPMVRSALTESKMWNQAFKRLACYLTRQGEAALGASFRKPSRVARRRNDPLSVGKQKENVRSSGLNAFARLGQGINPIIAHTT